MKQPINDYTKAIQAIKNAILKSRYKAAMLANRELLSLYYGIGEFISHNSRNGYWGKRAIEMIAEKLQYELPGIRGFSVTNLKNMRIFYEAWNTFLPNRQLATGDLEIRINSFQQIRQLSTGEITLLPESFFEIGFTHHIEILTKLKNTEERKFYINLCAKEFWSIEKLKFYIKSDLYKKQGTITNNFQKSITTLDFRRKALLSFKDEYLLDFINIEDPDEMDERIIENEIVVNIKKFIMALGTDFTFIGNQHRLIIDEKEYFIDLLFFNRKLQSLVAIELKNGDFKPEYAGKMNFYLSALDEYIKQPHENPSIGIILCKGKSSKTVEFAFRDYTKPMGVATYKISTELPPIYKDIIPNPEALKQLL